MAQRDGAKRSEHMLRHFNFDFFFVSIAVFNHFPVEYFLKPRGIDWLVSKELISAKNSKTENSPNSPIC